MERALRNRLTFGPLMLLGLFLLLWLDYAIEWKWTYAMITDPATGNRYGVGGVGLLILMIIIAPSATDELATLFAAEKVRPYRTVAAVGAGLLAVHAWLTQFPRFQPIATSTFAFIIVGVMIIAALRRAMGRHTQEAIHTRRKPFTRWPAPSWPRCTSAA
jgi:hypothetical protein